MQKTAYDMRISDWSSDVCSSDLLGGGDEELLADGEIQLAVHGLGEGRNDPAAARQAGPDLKRQGLADLPPALDLELSAEADELVAEGQLGTEAAVALPTQRQVEGLARTADAAGDFQAVPDRTSTRLNS